MGTNHKKAFELAFIKHDESNLARCYIEIHKELKELKDHINKVWDDTYPNSAPAETMLAIKNRVLNLAQDRNCWLFNARVANTKLNELEKKE